MKKNNLINKGMFFIILGTIIISVDIIIYGILAIKTFIFNFNYFWVMTYKFWLSSWVVGIHLISLFSFLLGAFFLEIKKNRKN